MNGSQCTYAHTQELRPLPDLQNTKLCESVTKGFECRNPSCTYAHCRDDLRAPGDLVAYKTALCFFFKKERCMNGDKCRFAHGPQELRPKGDDPVPTERESGRKVVREPRRYRRDVGLALPSSTCGTVCLSRRLSSNVTTDTLRPDSARVSSKEPLEVQLVSLVHNNIVSCCGDTKDGRTPLSSLSRDASTDWCGSPRSVESHRGGEIQPFVTNVSPGEQALLSSKDTVFNLAKGPLTFQPVRIGFSSN